MSGPIAADETGPQRAARVSGICSEREGASCEYIEIMHILPGSSDDTPVIDAPQAICNMGGDARLRQQPSGILAVLP
jgi:hypothetical protein